MLDTTLVVAMGEFGRTPQLNPRGGRDHWPGFWSVLFAGGGHPRRAGGRLVGRDRQRAEGPARHAGGDGGDGVPRSGHRPATRLAGADGRPLPLTEAAPVAELF